MGNKKTNADNENLSCVDCTEEEKEATLGKSVVTGSSGPTAGNGTKPLNKKPAIIIPAENYIGFMNKKEEAAVLDYRKQQFPELFNVRGLKDDKASEVPFLALIQSARILTALLEASIREKKKNEKDKIVH